VAEWIDLVDPDESELRERAPAALHPAALKRLLEPYDVDHQARPRVEAHGDYVLGVLLVAVALPDEDRVFYQEVDFVLTEDALLTVSKTPPGEQPFDPAPAKRACGASEHPAMFAYHLVDEIAERYLDLIDDLLDEVDEIEELVEHGRLPEVRRRLTDLRRDYLHVRRTLTPTRDAVHTVVDGRLALEGADLFPREVTLHFADAYDKLLRASEGLDLSRDLVAGVRDYAQSKIANDQNEVMKRLTVLAALFLPPTFLVGVYGQNFDHMPELHWDLGYAFSWAVIVAATAAQLVYFRRKRWI
jgi:magnesium transporter